MRRLHRVHLAFLCAGISLIALGGCASPPREHDQGPETAPEGLTALSREAIKESETVVSFARQVKPILENKCLACHSGESAPWGYRLDSREAAFARGAGGPRIVPGKPDESLFLALSSTHKDVAAMPLVGTRLTATESRILRRWIAEGAEWPAGKAGALKPGSDAVRPEHALMRPEWKAWFQKDDATQ